MMGMLDETGFVLETLNPARVCTVTSVAAHTLYEKSDPYHRSGAVEHAWLGPEIEKGVMVACETDDDGLAPVDLAPTFTVYQPNKNFSKKAPDDASFYVYASSAKPLTGRESQALLDCAGGKPVRVSTCRQSTVVMFTIAAPKVY